MGHKLPTQEEFDQAFSTPLEFGEGDHLLISQTFTKEEALAQILTVLKDEWGMDPKYYPTEVIEYDVGWHIDPDSYHHEDSTYWLAGEKTKGIWKAWGVQTS